jgi:hypothetical protein
MGIGVVSAPPKKTLDDPLMEQLFDHVLKLHSGKTKTTDVDQRYAFAMEYWYRTCILLMGHHKFSRCW